MARRVGSATRLPGKSLDFELTSSKQHAVVDARQLVFKTSSLALLKAKGVSVPGTYFPDDEVTSQSTYLKGAKLVLDYMNELFRNQKMCDVLIPVKQGELKAHKIALGAYSETLARRFAEFPPGEVMCIDMSDIPYEVVHTMLHFVYTTEIQVTCDTVGPLMHCATELGVDVLVHICHNFLMGFTVETALPYYDIAVTYRLEDVRQVILEFICENFAAICRTTSFLELSVDSLINWLCDDNIRVSELEIFEAIVVWVSYNKVQRLPLAQSLLRCVRFQLITPENLATKVESVGFMFEPRENHNLLYEAMKYHALKLSNSTLAASFAAQSTRSPGLVPLQPASKVPEQRTNMPEPVQGMPNTSTMQGMSNALHNRFSSMPEPVQNAPVVQKQRRASHHQVHSRAPLSLMSSSAHGAAAVGTDNHHPQKPTKNAVTPHNPQVMMVTDPYTGQRRPPRVAVIGAGAVGLCAAVRVQEEIPNAEITIVADSFNESTLSDGAAGIFRPSWEKAKGLNEDVLRQWAVDSFAKFDALLHSDLAAEAGISMLSGYQFGNQPVKEPMLIDGIVYHVRKCTPEDFHVFPETASFKYGFVYTTVCVESKWFLPFMMKTFMNKGGQVQNRTVENLQECVGLYDVVVNCTGLRAKELVNDSAVYSVRGQMERVRAPWIKHFLFDVEHETWVLPCRDTVVIGGTLQKHNDSLAICQEDKDRMVAKAVKMIPSLKKAEFQWTWVGLRPFRGPIRLEPEIINCGQNQTLKVVHNYGHGGHGIALSWGCACHAAQLVQNLLQE